MIPSNSYDDKVYVYALANPSLIYQQIHAIEISFFEAMQVVASDRHTLLLSESSAWLDYTAVGEIWDRKSPPALPERDNALKIAENVLGKIEQKCSDANNKWPEQLRGISLLPPARLLRRQSLHAIPRPDSSTWDHWLYRAEPQLLYDGGSKKRAGVYGSQIEVRIGHLGKIISIRSRWRPLSGERILTEMKSFVEDEELHPQRSEDKDLQPPIVNFLLEGDGIPQHYLAPYYFQTDGHRITMTSASSWSLTVDIGRTQQNDTTMILTALAQGGSGDYRYNWAFYSLSDFDSKFIEMGSGQTDIANTLEGKSISSSIEFPNGHYVVMINVRDSVTGAFKHHQQQVFSSAFLSSDESLPAIS